MILRSQISQASPLLSPNKSALHYHTTTDCYRIVILSQGNHVSKILKKHLKEDNNRNFDDNFITLRR